MQRVSILTAQSERFWLLGKSSLLLSLHVILHAVPPSALRDGQIAGQTPSKHATRVGDKRDGWKYHDTVVEATEVAEQRHERIDFPNLNLLALSQDDSNAELSTHKIRIQADLSEQKVRLWLVLCLKEPDVIIFIGELVDIEHDLRLVIKTECFGEAVVLARLDIHLIQSEHKHRKIPKELLEVLTVLVLLCAETLIIFFVRLDFTNKVEANLETRFRVGAPLALQVEGIQVEQALGVIDYF